MELLIKSVMIVIEKYTEVAKNQRYKDIYIKYTSNLYTMHIHRRIHNLNPGYVNTYT